MQTSYMSVNNAFVLTRTLSRQVGSAVQHVQSSSSELQAAVRPRAEQSRRRISLRMGVGRATGDSALDDYP